MGEQISATPLEGNLPIFSKKLLNTAIAFLRLNHQNIQITEKHIFFQGCTLRYIFRLLVSVIIILRMLPVYYGIEEINSCNGVIKNQDFPH